MKRLPDWEARLTAAIEKHRALDGAWGVSDCFRLAMDAVDALTGNNPGTEFQYDSELGAAKILVGFGYRDIGDALAQHFGLREFHPSFATRGDLVVVPHDGKIAAAVCDGRMVIGKSLSGLTFVPRSRATRAFRV